MFGVIWRAIKRIWRPFLVILVTAVIVGFVFKTQETRNANIKGFLAAFANQKQTVSTTVASVQDWQPTLEAVGTLRAVNGADLALEVAGVVESINFKSGDDVEAGTVLMHLRADDDEDKLRSLEAVAELAQITYDRDERQFKAQAVSQATLDADAANLKNDKAQVAQQRALIDKKTLRAPFAGHLGIRSVDLGQYMAAGTPVVTLQALDPIFIDFYMQEQALDVLKVGQKIAVQVDTYPDQTFTAEVVAINSKVDINTRNVQIRASLRNADHKLLPGMYATVRIDSGTPQRNVTLPQTAIAFNPYGSTVFLVEDKGKDDKGEPKLVAKQAFVTTGATRGDQIAVLKGVNEGDTVVTAGQNKLHQGSLVTVNNTVQSSNDPNPRPVDQ
jgi:membrane fusion protein (multidrug efflux system)